MYRIKQFIHALFPRVSEEDLLWVKETLTTEEYELFQQLPAHEQQHVIAVAKDCHRMNGSREVVKAGLLHDIGKINSNLNIINKSLVVLLSPLKSHGSLFPGFLRRAFHVKENHPTIGADLLRKTYLNHSLDNEESLTASQKRVLELIEAHHHGKGSRDNELLLLQQCDERH